jgi:hypothetical protein
MSKKIKFQFNQMTFELPSTALQVKKWDNNKPFINMNAKSTASVIKQYVKQKYGSSLVVWSTSDVYSGGSSVRVNVSTKVGSPLSQEIYNDIMIFSNSFKAGRFDGMYDCYEYRNDKVTTDNGTELDYFPSYIFVENKPKWDSIEYWVNEWNTFDPSNYTRPMVGKTLWEQFMNFNSSYWSKGTLEKLTKFFVNNQNLVVS